MQRVAGLRVLSHQTGVVARPHAARDTRLDVKGIGPKLRAKIRAALRVD